MNVFQDSIIDHLNIGVSDGDRSRDFYVKALAPLGLKLMFSIPPSGAEPGGEQEKVQGTLEFGNYSGALYPCRSHNVRSSLGFQLAFHRRKFFNMPMLHKFSVATTKNIDTGNVNVFVGWWCSEKHATLPTLEAPIHHRHVC